MEGVWELERTGLAPNVDSGGAFEGGIWEAHVLSAW